MEHTSLLATFDDYSWDIFEEIHKFPFKGFLFFCLFVYSTFIFIFFFYHFSYFNSPNSSNLYSKMRKIIFPIFFFYFSLYIIIMLDSRKENITPPNVYIFFFYPSLETIPFYMDLSVFL